MPRVSPSARRYTFMYARNSSGVEFSLPTSPISPPTEIGIPFGSRSRMYFVNRAHSVALTSCCASSVGFERSTSVDVSMSICRKPAGIASSMSAWMAAISLSADSAIFFGFVW